MRIGGWSRVGIVLSVLYGALVAFVAFDSRPRLENKESAWFYEAADAIAAVLTKTEGQDVRPAQVKEALLKGSNSENAAWLEKVAAAPSENQKKFSAQVAAVNEKHKALIATLSNEQRLHWFLAFVWWAGGVLLLLGTGWSVGWVYRGFRAPAS